MCRAPSNFFFFPLNNWSNRVSMNTDEEDHSMRKFGGEESEFGLKCIKFLMSPRFTGEFLTLIIYSFLQN